jgi:mono/diheme cytochrome c family protein
MTEAHLPSNEPSAPRVAAIVAEFADDAALCAAAAKVRDAGYRRWDCHSPYPVHGIDRAMGTRRTVLPWIVLGAGATGLVAALLMQWWMNAINYPYVISGKPLFSLPANIPIVFELIVLFSGLTAFFACLVLNQLPQFAHPVLSSRQLRRATSDGLFISIEARDAKFDPAATQALLESAGAKAVEVCYESGEGTRMPRVLKLGAVVAVLLACIPPLCITLAREVKSGTPRIHPIQDMDFQPKYKSQQASPLFADGRAMRPPVPGAVAVGELQENDHWYRGKVNGQPATTFPLPVTDSLMHRGRLQFNTFCAPCHGLTGAGDGPIAQREQQRKFRRLDPDWVPPLTLHNPTVVDQPVGKLFETITAGVRTMPSYGAQIAVEDRWAIIAYLRALQRSEKQ